MADITSIKKAVCTKAPGADPAQKAAAKANCEANMERVDVKACSYGTSVAKATSCVKKLVPSIFDAPAAPVTADDVVKKLGRGETPSAEELAKITPEYIKGLIANKDKDNNAIKLAAIEEAAKTNGTIKTALAAATAVAIAGGNESSMGSHSGFFAEADFGLALSTATYSDSVTDADTIASDNPIKTGAHGVGKSPSGAYPGHRYGVSLGYAVPVAKDVNIRVGLHGRSSAIQQGYENPQFGRSISDMSQLSGMAFIGAEKYFTPEFSIFADARIGVTHNKFSNNKGNLQTSAQANQYAALKDLEGFVLSGGAQIGATYRIYGLLSAYAALEIYGDATKASAKTDGGGAMDFGTKGVEFSGTAGLRVSK